VFAFFKTSRCFPSLEARWALVQIVIGIVCAIGSRFVSKLVWAIVLLMLGIVTGTIGGTLVAFGAILGIVFILVKSATK